jgi:acylphosphatase
MTKRVVVTGRVQGVFFRDSVDRIARELDVKGWVRNRHDGAVEAVFEGDQAAVERMLGFVRRGPSRAEVEHVDVFDESPGHFTDFHVE